ncbi:hypothetical protein COU57_04155 [Candidatus Pacearchaeota archaeon CG10_big_fil_rev_8_21_14_0_10_32_14]|nr:MAG: hypothetical protein COU57_04155 [Candidatus Pacearchaeota archaeon CG10_big_fil_rev_8_21_14_0_10_32_14]
MKQKNIKQIILEHYFINPSSKMRVRQIERELKIPLPSIIRYTKELEKEKLLSKLTIDKVVFYTASRDSKKFLLEKKLFNVKVLCDSGLIDYLIDYLSNPSIVIFGSFSKGEDIESSDIDLYIETPSKKEINLEKFEKLLKRKIQIFKQKQISDIKNPHLINNILNGITLNGIIEVIK